MVRDGSAQPASPTILAGTPRHGHIVRHGFQPGTGGDTGTMTDLDLPENFRAGPDQYAVADLGMGSSFSLPCRQA